MTHVVGDFPILSAAGAPPFRAGPENFPKSAGIRNIAFEYEICIYNRGGNMYSPGLANTMTRILLVDDENLILYSLSAALRHDGSEVATATNGKDALSEI